MSDLRLIQEFFNDETATMTRRVIKMWHRALNRSLDDLDITMPQFELLSAIAVLKHDNVETTQIALSQESCIDPMTTSTTIRNLQRKGLVTRTESLTDTRARIVELTDQGIDLLVEAIKKVKTLRKELVRGGLDKEIVEAQLRVLYNNLSNLNNK